MAVSVNIADSYVKIENIIKKCSITLDLNSWENLVACNEEVSKFLAAKKTGNWILHVEKNIRISISSYNNALFIHIREWKKEKPTIAGVYFYEKDWKDLQEHFVSSEESKIARKVMATIMRLETKAKMPQSCPGCVESYPSQTDHDCLMNAASLAYSVMDKIEIKPQEFILMMAQEALKQDHLLERPYQAYKRVYYLQMNAIKDEVVEADYNF